VSECVCKFLSDPGAPEMPRCGVDFSECDFRCALHFDARLGLLLERVEQAEGDLDSAAKRLADARADICALMADKAQAPHIETLPAVVAIAGAE